MKLLQENILLINNVTQTWVVGASFFFGGMGGGRGVAGRSKLPFTPETEHT